MYLKKAISLNETRGNELVPSMEWIHSCKYFTGKFCLLCEAHAKTATNTEQTKQNPGSLHCYGAPSRAHTGTRHYQGDREPPGAQEMQLASSIGVQSFGHYTKCK